ncbi:phosphodiester glycosidase family protein [Patescibacteria group bacterium]|nr:phosphodiester glycosidase family protein [Patescibacteria group bacterium]
MMITAIFGGCSNTPASIQKNTGQKIVQSIQTQWEEIRPGLSFAEINADGKLLQLAKIDPTKFRFSIYQNENKDTAKTIKEIHNEQNSLLTFNGQFFTEDFKPTGLLISNSEEKNRYVRAELLNGIFAIDRTGKARLLSSTPDSAEPALDFAIQSGPVLLDKNGDPQIESDTQIAAGRTAVGLDKDGNIIVIILKQSILNFDNSISLYYFSHLLKDDPFLHSLGLNSVLNLDGGTSTGLMIGNKYYPEMEKVQNVIIVKNKL